MHYFITPFAAAAFLAAPALAHAQEAFAAQSEAIGESAQGFAALDPRIATDDQRGPIRTGTYESIETFMRANSLLADSFYSGRP